MWSVNIFIAVFLCIYLNFSSAHTFEDFDGGIINEELLNTLVSHPNFSDGVKFYLYTRKNPLKFEQLQLNNLHYLKWTNFDPSRPVKIIIHGWRSSHRSAYSVLVKNAFLLQYNANVVVVDWNEYAKLFYTGAKRLVPKVAEVVALLLDGLHGQLNIPPEHIHMVGHSLGAHIVGIAGKKASFQVARVTGLDPAGPLFSIEDVDRLGLDSAKFVDVIHTAGKFAGFFEPLGHVDFYPNGGVPIQPGCGLDVSTLISHRRAYWLFAESITTVNGFRASKCESWDHYTALRCSNNSFTLMGEHVSPNARGSFFLRTNSKTPYSLIS